MSLLRLFDSKKRTLQFYVRGWYYSRLFKSCGSNLQVRGSLHISHPAHITIGNNCSLNHGVHLQGRAPISIADNVHISAGAMLLTGGLDYTSAEQRKKHIAKPITIEKNAWIGAKVIILPGVTIGKNSVIGAGAVVTKNVPAGTVVAGVPAKPIK